MDGGHIIKSESIKIKNIMKDNPNRKHFPSH